MVLAQGLPVYSAVVPGLGNTITGVAAELSGQHQLVCSANGHGTKSQCQCQSAHPVVSHSCGLRSDVVSSVGTM